MKCAVDLTNAEAFTKAFFRSAETKPSASGDRPATIWFQERMTDLANQACLHVQQKRDRSGDEWMRVDHVFVSPAKSYAEFPLVVVEHENGDLSSKSKRGEVPDGNEPGAFMEWAVWKALAMVAKLHVVVAYPWLHDRPSALRVIAEMVAGRTASLPPVPNALFLLGWWSRGWAARSLSEWDARELYVPYVPQSSANGRVELVEAHWAV